MGILTVVLVIYFASMVAIGWVGRHRSQTFESYLNMGRSGGVILLMGGIIGGQIGNGFVIGGAAEGAVVGLAGSAYGLACAVGCVISAALLTDFIYKNNYLSMADYTFRRYNSHVPGTIYDLSTAISCVGMIAGQIMAGQALFEALGLPGEVGALAIAVVVFLYSQMSGLWGAYATSVVQVGVIIVGLIITVIVLLSKGAVGEMQSAIASGSLASSSLDFSGLSVAGFAAMMLPMLLGMVTNQSTYQTVVSAKSARTAKMANYLGCLVMIPLAVMPAFVGAYGAFKYGAAGNDAFFMVVMNELPPLVYALIIAAVLAAVMSTIDAALIVISTCVTRDIWQGALKKTASESKLKKITLCINIGVMGVSTVLALSSSSILDLLNAVYAFLSAACFVPFVGGVFWKRGNTQGAVAASIAGVIAVVLNFFGVVYPFPVVFPILISAVAYVVASLATQGKSVKA